MQPRRAPPPQRHAARTGCCAATAAALLCRCRRRAGAGVATGKEGRRGDGAAAAGEARVAGVPDAEQAHRRPPQVQRRHPPEVPRFHHRPCAGTAPLPWSIRLKIALGAAKGLAFLHEETERPVIFRDLKTSNVLLDAFGLAEDTMRSGRPDASPNELYSQSAIYVAAAHALKPNYSVYRSALRLVRSMLPLPYFKVGHLTAPPAPIAPHKDWVRSQFVLNHEGLQQADASDQPASQSPGHIDSASKPVRIDVADIVSVAACADLTLPPGAGLCIDTIHGPRFLVADNWDALDGWLDAIRLVYTIFARGKTDVLAGIITG